jgi:hypothetical protein
MLPIKIINRLNLGRSVAAIAPALHPGCLAWMLVKPIIDPEKAIIEERTPGFERLVRSRVLGDNPIAYYLLRYIEIPQQLYEREINCPFDWDYDLVVASYQQVLAFSEQEVAHTLSHWQINSETLRIPGNVGFPSIGYFEDSLQAQSLTRQLITVLRTFPEQTLFSFRMVQPIWVTRFHGDERSGSSKMIHRKRYAGCINALKYEYIIFEPHQKLKQPSRDRIALTNMVTYLDPSSMRFWNGTSWTPIPIQLDPKLSDLTQLDCYNAITYRWLSYTELLMHNES